MRGRLLLVPNALDGGAGDLGDALPHSVIATAARLGHWVAESAKSARAFLKRVDALVPLAQPLQAVRIVEWPRAGKGGARTAAPALAPLLAPALDGHDLGLLSEAGLPAVADPGAALVAAAHDAGLDVVPLAGPNAVVLALAASGLDGQSFAFVGYLPTDAAARAARLRGLEARSRQERQTQLMIETPYRNAALLAALLDALQPSTRLAVACGVTMARGWTRSATVAAWRAEPRPLPADVPAVFALQAA